MTWPSKFSYRQQLSGCREDRYVMGKTVFFLSFFDLHLAMRSYLEPYEQYFLCIPQAAQAPAVR